MRIKIDNHLVNVYKATNEIIDIWWMYQSNELQTHFLYDLEEHKFFAYEGINFLTKRQTKMLEKKILKLWGGVVNEN